jgi:hypothetical protein
MNRNVENWIFECHQNHNFKFRRELPFEILIKIRKKVFDEFSYLLDDQLDLYTGRNKFEKPLEDHVTLREACGLAILGVELMEFCNCNYMQIQDNLTQSSADIIYALTEQKGKTRQQRKDETYYKEILNTSGASFVFLFDMISKVRYLQLTGSPMIGQYKEEFETFKKYLKKEKQVSNYKNVFFVLEKIFNQTTNTSYV